ncbi:unnamed protein product [Mucor hiemalis]
MKVSSVLIASALLVASFVNAAPECSTEDTKLYAEGLDYSSTLQDLIDEASRLNKPVVYLSPGLFTIDPKQPIVLRKGVSLKGNPDMPSILSVNNKTATGTIEGM